jgi:hypothetical protein
LRREEGEAEKKGWREEGGGGKEGEGKEKG